MDEQHDSLGADGKEPEAMHDLLALHSALDRIVHSLMAPLDMVEACCRELAPLFAGFHFTIAVYYPESRLLEVHAPGQNSRRVACDEVVEGYFLHNPDEDVLAIEEGGLHAAAGPLCSDGLGDKEYQGGLFVAARVQNTLVGILGLRSIEPAAWQPSHIDLARAAARGFGIAYYNATVCDNLTYSCREAHRKLDAVKREAQTWRRRAEHIRTATEIARAIPASDSISDLVEGLHRVLSEQWPDCRMTIQRFLPEANGFEHFPAANDASEVLRPARHCIQNLFLNNIPVAHIVCDSPQEITSYTDLDPHLVSECKKEDFRSFCTVPVFLGRRLWGTISVQSREAGGCGPHVELLSEIGRVLADPIQMLERRARMVQQEATGEQTRPFHALLESAGVPALVVDPESGAILHVNPLAVDLLGTTAERLCGESLPSLGVKETDRTGIGRLCEEARQKVIARLDRVSLSCCDGRTIERGMESALLPSGDKPSLVVTLRELPAPPDK